MVIFGGDDGGPQNDTWQLTLPTGGTATWSLMGTSGTPPSARAFHSAIFDAANRRMVIFAGPAPYRNDVWELPMTTLAWNQIAALPSPQVGLPPERGYHRAVYDPVNQRMVIYGGSNANFIMGDTWSLPLSGSPQWKALSPTARLSPLVVFDPSRAKMVVLGGLSPSGLVLEDVWTYNLTGPPLWTQIMPVGPLPDARVLGSAIYDRVNDRVVMFGGFGTFEYNDVWALSFGPPASWTELNPLGLPPSPRYDHSAVYDEAGEFMWMFGGRSNVGSASPEVWSLSLNSPSGPWASFNLAGPSPREGHAAVLDPVYWGDPAAGHLVVFGGSSGGVPFNDSWDLPLNAVLSWNPMAGPAPSARSNAAAIYDRLRDHMLLFGGASAGGDVNDLWQLRFYDTKVWSQAFPAGVPPPPRERSGSIYDTFGDRMLVFAGRSGTNFFTDLWQLDLTGVPVGVPGYGPAADLRVGRIAPNPSSGRVRLSVELPEAGQVELAVYDVAGRLAHSSSRLLPAGRQELTWDGRDPAGRRARAGVYLARVRVGVREQVRRVVLLGE